MAWLLTRPARVSSVDGMTGTGVSWAVNPKWPAVSATGPEPGKFRVESVGPMILRVRILASRRWPVGPGYYSLFGWSVRVEHQGEGLWIIRS